MAKIKSWFNCDLQKAVQVQALNGNVFSMDNNGNQICVRIFDGGEKAVISATVTARCILADGSTVNLNGSLESVDSQSVAVVDIPQSVLLIHGTLKISVQLTASSVVATIAAIITTVYATKTDNVITPSSQVISDWNTEISAQLASAVKFSSQSLTDSQKTQARTNIGAAGSAEMTAALALKVNVSDIENDLTGETAGKVLDARQGKVLDDKVSDLKSALYEITGNEKISFTTKKFIALNGSTADITNMLTPSGNCNCAVVPCTQGDSFIIYATGGNSARAWAFINNNNSGQILEVAGANKNANGLVLVAPANTTHLIINDNSAPPSKSYKGSELLINKVNDVVSLVDSYNIKTVNRYDKTSADNEDGKYLQTSTGALLNNSSYTTSGYIDVSDLSKVVLSYVHIYCFYDSLKTFVPNSGGSSSGYDANDYSVAVPNTAKYIRVSFPTTYISKVQIGKYVTREHYYGYNSEFVFEKLLNVKQTIVVAKDGSGDYTSFTEAIYNTWNSGIDVVVKPGTYDIEAEYDDLFTSTVVDAMTDSTDLDGFQFGVRLNNRKITFESGSHLVCDWSDHTVSGTRRFSAIRVDANVVIDGMDLDVTGAFYAVHDDYGLNAIPFTNVYKNCRIVGHSLYNANCIGGGCKRYSRHILENCYFDNGRTNVTTVRYHNYALNQDAEPVIWVSNCYFNSLFTPRWAGTQTTKMTVYVNNCYAEAIYKLAEGSSENDNVVLIKWNNTETNPHE